MLPAWLMMDGPLWCQCCCCHRLPCRPSPALPFHAPLCYVSVNHPAPYAPVLLCRHLHIPLVQAERAWAYAMDLKSQLEQQMEAQVGPEGVRVTEECSLASAGEVLPSWYLHCGSRWRRWWACLGRALLPTVQDARLEHAAAAVLPAKRRLPARLPNHPPAHRSGST